MTSSPTPELDDYGIWLKARDAAAYAQGAAAAQAQIDELTEQLAEANNAVTAARAQVLDLTDRLTSANAATAAAQAKVADLTSQLSTASGKITDLTAQLAAANAATSAAQAKVTDLTAQLATAKAANTALQAAFDAYRASHPDPAVTTMLGISFPSTVRAVDATYEDLAEGSRIFFQGLSGVSFANDARVKRALADGVDTFVISWTEQDATLAKTFLATIPAGLKIYAAFKHEPEDDMTSALWKSVWAKMSPVIRTAGCIPTQILMAFTARTASGRDFLGDWFLGNLVDVVAWDAYVDKYDPADQVNVIVAACKAAGVKRTAIMETGSVVGDVQRPAKLTALLQAVVAANAAGVVRFEIVAYWNAKIADVVKNGVTVVGPDYRLDDKAAAAFYGATSLTG